MADSSFNLDDAYEVLQTTLCPLCPNVIGAAPFHLMHDPTHSDIINKLVELKQGTVHFVRGRGIRFILVHVSCVEAAGFIQELEDGK